MRVRLFILLSLVSLILLCPRAEADTLRCGSRLVSVGDSREKAAEVCGEPDERTYEEAFHDTWFSQLYDYRQDRYQAPRLIKGPIVLETWTYRFGANRLPHFLYFEDGRLIRIETGDKVEDKQK